MDCLERGATVFGDHDEVVQVGRHAYAESVQMSEHRLEQARERERRDARAEAHSAKAVALTERLERENLKLLWPGYEAWDASLKSD